ncbi:MAG: diversity-generating retroelement protein Avd [Candidatus Saccharimonadales bacterium]
MEQTDIPIFKKLYELYKLLHLYRTNMPKADRYSLWQKAENTCLEILELILNASRSTKAAKLPALQAASTKLNLLRVFIRLAKDTRAIDHKKYVNLQSLVDEIGRMLGGWLRSVKPDPPPSFLATTNVNLSLHLT